MTPTKNQYTDADHDQACIACRSWHEDGGEGPSMFCPDVEPLVVTRGPNWKPPTKGAQAE